jgi:polar amino acid transport system permease protein
MTVFLAVTATAASTFLGLFLGIVQALGGRLVRGAIFVYVQLIRGVPFLTFVFWVFFLLPEVMGHQASGVESALVALTLFNAAFIVETVRGGISSVSKGQYESALSVGLTRLQAFTNVILPQAIRKIYPLLVNRFVNLLLGTSMVYIVGVNELTRMAMIVNNNDMQHPAQIFGVVGALYFAMCFPLSLYLDRLHKRARTEGL